MTSPLYRAARSGLSGDQAAVNTAGQVNQMLTTHPIQVAQRSSNQDYFPNLVPGTYQNIFTWQSMLGTDWAVLIGQGGGQTTTFQGLQVPVRPVGRGADLVMHICADDGTGKPGGVIQTNYLPADALNALVSTDGSLSGPLQTAWSHVVIPSLLGENTWQGPATGLGGELNGTTAYNGNYMVMVGGTDKSSNAVNQVVVIPWIGNGEIGLPLQGTPLPTALAGGILCITDDTIMVAGGFEETNGTITAGLQTVWTASWSGLTGQIGAWTQQPNLPIEIAYAPAVYDPVSKNVYVVGGVGQSGGLNTVYRAKLTNGQLGSWVLDAPLPVAAQQLICAIIDGYLVIGGGSPDAANALTDFSYSKINADGSLGPFQATPSTIGGLPTPVAGFTNVVLPHAIVTFGSTVDPGFSGTDCCGVVFSGDGQGDWKVIGLNNSGQVWMGQPGAFYTGDGQWDVFLVNSGSYMSMRLNWVPYPMVQCQDFFGVLNMNYYVVLHQVGGDESNYLELGTVVISPGTEGLQPTYENSGAGWVNHPEIFMFYSSQDPNQSPLWAPTAAVLMTSDVGTRITQMVSATTLDNRLLGVIESTPRTRRNLCSNPSFEVDTSSWATSGTPAPTIAQSTDYAYSGTHSLKITSTGSASFFPNAGTTINGLTIGATYTASCYAYVPAGNPSLTIYLSGGALGSGTGSTTGQWVRISITFQATATTHTIGITQSSTASGQIGYIDAVLIEEASTVGSYFAGPLYEDPEGMFATSVVAIEYTDGFPTGVTTIDPVAPA